MPIGLEGTGLMTSTGRYPNVNLHRFTNQATCGTAWANQIQTCIMAIQNDLVNAKAVFSTFASYVQAGQSVSGGAAVRYHVSLLNVATNQHHRMLHGSTHVWGAAGDFATVAPDPFYSAGRDRMVFYKGILLYVDSSYNYYYIQRSHDLGETWLSCEALKIIHNVVG